MLHFETVTTETLDLLRAFQSFDTFRGLRLIEGTTLALQYGHRRSVDLDFFGTMDLSDDDLLLTLKEIGPTRLLRLSKTIKTLSCKEIKVDIVQYPYRWISDPVHYDELILAADKDIAAMKNVDDHRERQ